MAFSHRRTLAVATLLVALAACGGEASTTDTSSADSTPPTEPANTEPASTEPPATDPPATEPPATEPASTEPPATEPPASSTPAAGDSDLVEVVLLEQGSEPRSVLRWNLTAGTSTQTFTQRQNLAQEFGGSQQPAITVALQIGSEMQVTPTTEGFEAVSTITAVGAPEGTDPGQAAATEQSLSGLVGVRSTIEFDDQGRTLRTELDEASLAGASPEMVASISDMIGVSQGGPPLPAEAVGIGAFWQTEQELTVNGISIVQTAGYRLIAIDGNTLTIELSGAQAPLTDIFRLPGPDGVDIDVKIEEWSTVTSGSLVMDLTTNAQLSRLAIESRQVLITADVGQIIQNLDGVVDLVSVPTD